MAASWSFVGAVLGMLAGAVWWKNSERVEYSATVPVWTGVWTTVDAHSGRWGSEESLRQEFRERERLEEVVRRMKWESQRGIGMESGVRELEEMTEVRFADEVGWIEVTIWQQSPDEARGLARMVVDVFWETIVTGRRAQALAELEADREELERAEAELDGWDRRMTEIFREELEPSRQVAPGRFSDYRAVRRVYEEAQSGLQLLKLQQSSRRIALKMPKLPIDVPWDFEVGSRRVFANPWWCLGGGMVFGGGCGGVAWLAAGRRIRP